MRAASRPPARRGWRRRYHARAVRGEALFALIVDGSRVAAWLDPSRALDPPAVVVLRVTHTDDAVVLHVDATSGSLSPLVGIATSFAE